MQTTVASSREFDCDRREEPTIVTWWQATRTIYVPWIMTLLLIQRIS